MSGDGIAAVLVGLGTFLGGLVVAYRGLRGDKFQRKVTESAALLTGYTEMVGSLRKEIDAIRSDNDKETDRLRRQHQTEIRNLHDLHDSDRERWTEERTRLEERIEVLEAQVAALLYRPGQSPPT